MINFTWTFNLQRTIPYDINTSNTNIIKTLGWIITGIDSEYTNKSSSVSGCIDFDISSLPNFKPINEITNADLQTGVEDRIGIDKINIMMDTLINQINALPNDWNPIPNS